MMCYDYETKMSSYEFDINPEEFKGDCITPDNMFSMTPQAKTSNKGLSEKYFSKSKKTLADKNNRLNVRSSSKFTYNFILYRAIK